MKHEIRENPVFSIGMRDLINASEVALLLLLLVAVDLSTKLIRGRSSSLEVLSSVSEESAYLFF